MGTIVAALGGSLLRPEIEKREIWLTELVDTIGKIVNNGTKIGLVVGGGSPARESIDLVRPLISNIGALDKIGIRFSTYVLQIGDIPVIVVVSAPHRKAAFEACEFAIDTLKETVPIWKKEHFSDGEVWVNAHP